jgi:replicative DNA helicase
MLEPPPEVGGPLIKQELFMNKNPRRQPLWSNIAEQSVLGAIMLDHEAMDDIADILKPLDFYSEVHRTIFQAMQTILDGGQPANQITINHFLYNNNKLQSVGGGSYLANLLETVQTTVNANYYAYIIREKSVLRELLR